MRVGNAIEVQIAEQDLLGPFPGADDDPPRRITDEGFAGKGETRFGADPVAERREESVLEGSDLHLGFVEALRSSSRRSPRECADAPAG